MSGNKLPIGWCTSCECKVGVHIGIDGSKCCLRCGKETIGPFPRIQPVEERDEVMQFFDYSHLPEHLQKYSKPFCELAEWMKKTLPANREREKALDKLLEAKDAAVRSTLAKK